MKKIFLYIIILAFAHPGSFAQVTDKDSISVSDYAEAYTVAKTRDSSLKMPPYYANTCMRLKLFPIDQNEDSLAVRLWVSSRFGYSVMTLSKKDDILEGHKYYYTKNKVKEKNFRPRFPIEKLVDTLQAMDFKYFPVQSAIKNFRNELDDGVTYTLELIYHNAFAVFQYRNPAFYKDLANYRFCGVLRLFEWYFRID